MKRVYIALAMLALIAIACFYSLHKVNRAYYTLEDKIELVYSALDQNDRQQLGKNVDDLCAYWKDEERSLVHFVRHAQIDEITKSIARLPSFAKYGDYADLSAELNCIRLQMENIRDSEPPTWNNLL